MKKIIITDKIKKEFLKCFVDGKCKIKDFDLKKVEITSSIIKFENTECKVLKNIKEFLEKIKNVNLKEILLSDKIRNLADKYQINLDKEIVSNAYNTLRSKWGYKIVKLSKTDVCPYCNRNFIINFNETNTTVELDHYFPKTLYPYLALNIYNLVPSCHTCNHKKNKSNKMHLHPFFDDINKEIKFSLKLKNINFYYLTTGFNIEIQTNSEKAQNHKDVFNLESLYNEHKDIILELIQKKYMYDESYLDELTRKYEGILFKNKEDLMRLISGGYICEDEINKRPLSKLIKDISEQLKLF